MIRRKSNDPAAVARLAEAVSDSASALPAEAAVVLLNYKEEGHDAPVAWLDENVLAWGASQERGPAVTCAGTTIRLRDPSTMAAVQTWDHVVRPVWAGVDAFGKFLVTRGEDGLLRVWAAQGFLLAEIAGDRASFSRKGDRVVVVSPDGKVRLMRISEPGKWLTVTDFMQFSEGDLLREVVDAAFCADDKAIVAITHNPQEIILWGLGQQQPPKTFRLKTEGNAMHGISLSEDLRYAVTLCDVYTGSGFFMQKWDLETQQPLPIPGGDGAVFLHVDDAGLLVDGSLVWHRGGSVFIDGRPCLAADQNTKWELKRSVSVGASSSIAAPGYPRLLGPVMHALEIENDYITTWSFRDGHAIVQSGLWNTIGSLGTDDTGFSPCGSWFWQQRMDGDTGTLIYRQNDEFAALSALPPRSSGGKNFSEGPPPNWLGHLLRFLARGQIARSGEFLPMNRVEWLSLRRELLAIATEGKQCDVYISLLRLILRVDE